MNEIDVFIEISKNSSIKYEYDIQNKALRCDRLLHTPLKYGFNYGFIPDTISGDGDPLDVIVLMEDELILLSNPPLSLYLPSILIIKLEYVLQSFLKKVLNFSI